MGYDENADSILSATTPKGLRRIAPDEFFEEISTITSRPEITEDKPLPMTPNFFVICILPAISIALGVLILGFIIDAIQHQPLLHFATLCLQPAICASLCAAALLISLGILWCPCTQKPTVLILESITPLPSPTGTPRYGSPPPSTPYPRNQ